MYVMLDTRFDIAYFVIVINRYVFNFDEIHWTIVKRIFRYLKNTLHFRLIFSNFLWFLIDWIDVNWINNKIFVVQFLIMFLILKAWLLFNFLTVNSRSHYRFVKLNIWIKFKLSKKLFNFSNCSMNWIHSACLLISKKFS